MKIETSSTPRSLAAAPALPPAPGSHGLWWATVLLAVVLVYLLGIGPVSAVANLHPPSESGWAVIDTVYQPLVKLCDKAAANVWLLHYEQWWERRLGADSTFLHRRPGSGPVPNYVW